MHPQSLDIMEALGDLFEPNALVWASVQGRSLGGTHRRTRFPWSQLEAFVVSEQSKGWCTFTTEDQLKRRTVAELLAEGKQIRTNTHILYGDYGRTATRQCHIDYLIASIEGLLRRARVTAALAHA